MGGGELFYRFDFDEQPAFHDQVGAIRNRKMQALVVQRDSYFARISNAGKIEFFSKTLSVDLLVKSQAEFTMDSYRESDEGLDEGSRCNGIPRTEANSRPAI